MDIFLFILSFITGGVVFTVIYTISLTNKLNNRVEAMDKTLEESYNLVGFEVDKLELELKDLKSKGVEIHVRSVFLQGMLLLEPENLDPYFEPVLDFFQKLSLYSQEAGTSLLHTCLRFVLFQDEVDGVIVGVKSFKELNEILNTPNFSVPFKLPEPDTCINDTKFTYPLNWPMYN